LVVDEITAEWLGLVYWTTPALVSEFSAWNPGLDQSVVAYIDVATSPLFSYLDTQRRASSIGERVLQITWAQSKNAQILFANEVVDTWYALDSPGRGPANGTLSPELHFVAVGISVDQVIDQFALQWPKVLTVPVLKSLW
jgi:hypothetical protein